MERRGTNRRGFLRGVGAATVTGISVSAAGCLEALGFEEESAWANPPLVEDRPDAVYLPAGKDRMGSYGRAAAGDVAVSLTYTFPHRFWLVRDDEASKVEVGSDDTHHLMCTVWDRETGLVLPADLRVEIRRAGEVVSRFTPWPMLSQRMGFHYGDNVTLPEEGDYTAQVRVSSLTADPLGSFAGRFEDGASAEVDFEYARSDVLDIGFDEYDQERWGTRDAVPLMDHGDHAGGDGAHDGHAGSSSGDPGPPPTGRAPSVDDLPGTHLGTGRSGDATLSVHAVPDLAEEGTYLAVSMRTPYNEVAIPDAALSATVDGGGDSVTLSEAIHEDLGRHYGATVDAIGSGAEVTVTVDRPPGVTRHDGYETAFFAFDPVTVTR